MNTSTLYFSGRPGHLYARDHSRSTHLEQYRANEAHGPSGFSGTGWAVMNSSTGRVISKHAFRCDALDAQETAEADRRAAEKRFPYSVYAVDRAGVPWEILRSANPIDAFKVADERRSRNLVTMVGHDDEEGWLDEDDSIQAYLESLTDEQLQRTLMIVRAQLGSTRDFAGLDEWLVSLGRYGDIDRGTCVEGIYDALYPRVAV